MGEKTLMFMTLTWLKVCSYGLSQLKSQTEASMEVETHHKITHNLTFTFTWWHNLWPVFNRNACVGYFVSVGTSWTDYAILLLSDNLNSSRLRLNFPFLQPIQEHPREFCEAMILERHVWCRHHGAHVNWLEQLSEVNVSNSLAPPYRVWLIPGG